MSESGFCGISLATLLAAIFVSVPAPRAHSAWMPNPMQPGIAASTTAAGPLTIAAAADTQFAMRELVAAFERRTGVPIRLVTGSSGNFTTQIEHGAPYDLFFSADVAHAQKLEREGLTAPGSLTRYAVGRLVVFVPADSPLDLEHAGLEALASASVKRIAIANPRFAPYGRAAIAALRHAGLYDKLESKIVLGEDVAQTTQFVATGNSQAGLTALALMLAPGNRAAGRYWLVPSGDYPALEQAAVIVARSRQQALARSFLDFLRTPAAHAILSRYGFGEPAAPRSGP